MSQSKVLMRLSILAGIAMGISAACLLNLTAAFLAVQLIFIGILGEYVMQVFNYVDRRPLVIEKERINF